MDQNKFRMTFSQDDIDIIGEVSNISMGAAATALSSIMGKKVTITSPHVDVGSMETIEKIERIPSVGVMISYTQGIVGNDVLIIRQADAIEIIKTMMGEDIPVDSFDEIYISAISEVMNQMMGSAATSLSSFLGKSVNISPPSAFILTDENKRENLKFIYDNLDNIILVRFLFNVEDTFESDIYMIMTDDFSKELVDVMMKNMGMTPQVRTAPVAEKKAVESYQPPLPVEQPRQEYSIPVPASSAYREEPPSRINEAAASIAPLQAIQTSVRAVKLPVFEEAPDLSIGELANFGLIQDVPLELAVEVGRAKKLVKEVIDFTIGSIIELDKQAGDPVDVIVNGQLIAHGEVVVIDESFGVRITDIISKKNRVN